MIKLRLIGLLFLLTSMPHVCLAVPSSFKPLQAKGIRGGWNEYSSSGAESRCRVADCICRVKPSKGTKKTNKKKEISRRLSVYFDEGSSRIDVPSSNRISSFYKGHFNSSFTVIGYTDGCGSASHNLSLAESRAGQVKSALSSLGAKDITDPLFKPEVTKGCSPRGRRVDVIAHTTGRITTIIDKIPADVYLIDASGSMWSDWRDWSDVVSSSYLPGSKIYVSKTIECEDGQGIGDVKPSGGTEIWYSYWKVLDFMAPGQTLAIISDFRSDVPLTKRESIIIENKVAKKNVRVLAIQL